MEEIAKNITLYVSHSVEIISALIIGIALVRLIIQSIPGIRLNRNDARKALPEEPGRLRMQFGSSVAIALELLLGADVLATAVSPGWNDIGQLAAIAVIRTALNYFLGKELKEANVTAQRNNS